MEVGGNSLPPAPKYPVDGYQPRQNAGSPSYPLDFSAALSGDGKLLTLAVINPTESTQAFDLKITGAEPRGTGRVWRLTGPGFDAMTGLTRKEVQVTELPRTLRVAPLSIDLYELERR